jgi:hypothetical protein
MKVNGKNFEYFVHWRNLPKKNNDGIYPNVSWSDVLLQGVPLDTTCYTQSYSDYMNHVHELVQENHQESSIMVNDRDVPDNIISSETTPPKSKGEGKFHRSRKIPEKKNKNYPTKPHVKGDDKIIKVPEQLDYFNWEINHAEQESQDVLSHLENGHYCHGESPRNSCEELSPKSSRPTSTRTGTRIRGRELNAEDFLSRFETKEMLQQETWLEKHVSSNRDFERLIRKNPTLNPNL